VWEKLIDTKKSTSWPVWSLLLDRKSCANNIFYYLDSTKIDLIYALDKYWCTKDGAKKLKKFASEHGYGCRNIIDVLCKQETYKVSLSLGSW
jgi:hypothetical protein